MERNHLLAVFQMHIFFSSRNQLAVLRTVQYQSVYQYCYGMNTILPYALDLSTIILKCVMLMLNS